MMPRKLTRPVVRLSGTNRLLAAIGVAVIVWFGWNPDARFESSDARWWDSTVNFKERNFDVLKLEFDAYRTQCRTSDVRLLRTTSMQAWNVGAWPFYLAKEQWHVPFHTRAMCGVNSPCPMGGSIACGVSPKPRLERP
jgi:hypothetical protein